jgi:hypothetical protein
VEREQEAAWKKTFYDDKRQNKIRQRMHHFPARTHSIVKLHDTEEIMNHA